VGLVERLIAICGPDRVISSPVALATYESDALLQYHATPAAVVLPDDTDEVSRILALCHAEGLPWVARGSGTSLSGGSTPVEGGVVIGLARMRRILEVDLPNRRIVVQPGVTNASVTAAVAGAGYFYPPDPSSQIVCSIGGNVAENSGGVHCFKYGFTTNYVMGCDVVLPDGEVVTLGGDSPDVPGYDLLGAFVGSEGTLGIATRIILRLAPAPEATRTVVAYFDSIAEAGQVVTDAIAAGVEPAAMEIMDPLAIAVTEAATGAGNRTDVGALLIVELDGSAEECEAGLAGVVELCRKNNTTGLRIAADDAERMLIWKARKAAFGAWGQISPNFFVQDGVVPRTRLPQVLARMDRMAEEYGLRVASVFHAGDGNLHPIVLYDGAEAAQAARAEELSGRIVEVCVEEGGSLTGEHGIGLDKKRSMPKMFSEADLATFQRLRCAFDPAGKANPDKVMPTPRLCGEVPGPYRQHPLEAAGIAERM
jgi:glycolate oxidase